jgi:4-diphosphocytidyl-2-C-methyl-D-erythritol kinase
MICFPNAKVNLGLLVRGRRTDGFHDIETVFYPIPLCDVLEILPAGDGQSSLSIYGNRIPGGEENLCMKAYRLLEKRFAIPPLAMHLLKRIPAGAGLGGGSSDAAHVLLMLNDLFRLNISSAELEKYAAQLGSDCPFFIRNRPCIASGRGEVMEDIELDLSSCRIEVKTPGIHVSTAEAYAMVTPDNNRVSLRAVIGRPVNEWQGILTNDFEEPVFKKYPEIKELKEHLYAGGAVYASMSGSGSVVYGIFPQ